MHLGRIDVSNFSNTEAEVILKEGIYLSGRSGNNEKKMVKYDSLIVSGVKHMNRSLQGDFVVVQVLVFSSVDYH